MSFEPKKFEQIYADMVAITQRQMPGVTDFQVGSVVRTMYESFAYEIALLYQQMDQVYLSAFVDTATGTQLDMAVAILGIQRNLPDFAEGTVTFERDLGTEAIDIPLGTLVTTEDTEKSPKKAYKTIETKIFPADQSQLEVKVQAVERGEENVVPAEAIVVMPQPVPGVKSVINPAPTQFTGKRSETDSELRQRAKAALLSSGKASRVSIESALLSLPGVREVKVIEPFSPDQPDQIDKCGLVDVFVDGVDFSNETRVQYLQSQIDRVRAAGVFVRLQSAIAVQVDAIFRIELDPSQKRSEGERRSLEESVRQAIVEHLNEMRMGQPLLFAQLIRKVLSVAGVNNLEQFAIATHTSTDRGIQTNYYTVQDRRIHAEESEKFKPRTIRVTSETQSLLVQIQAQVPAIDRTLHLTILTALNSYFKGLQVGQSVPKSEIQARISGVVPETLRLTAQPWSSIAQSTPEYIDVSFAERAQLDEVFLYRDTLKLIGAVKFIPRGNLTSRDKEQVQTEIRQRIVNYLNRLKPEAAVDLQALKQAAQAEDSTFAVADLNLKDFRVIQGNTESPWNQDTLQVPEFQKAELTQCCITSSIEPVQVTITALQLKLILPPVLNNPPAPSDPPESRSSEVADAVRDAVEEVTDAIEQAMEFDPEAAIAAIKPAIIRAIQTFPQPAAGENLRFASLRQALLAPISTPELQNILRGATYDFDQLTVTATSIDNRIQTSTLATAQDIHIRSVEAIASLTPPTPDQITFTSLTPNS